MRKPIPSVGGQRRESERDKREEKEKEKENFYNNNSTSGTRYQYIPRDIVLHIYYHANGIVVVPSSSSNCRPYRFIFKFKLLFSSGPHRLVQITAENQSKVCLLKCACMFSAVIIEIIIQRIATMPYKLNKVSTFTSSGGSIKVLKCGSTPRNPYTCRHRKHEPASGVRGGTAELKT